MMIPMHKVLLILLILSIGGLIFGYRHDYFTDPILSYDLEQKCLAIKEQLHGITVDSDCVRDILAEYPSVIAIAVFAGEK